MKSNKKTERILSYKLSHQFTLDDLKKVSGGGSSSGATGEATYSQNTGKDVKADVNHDF